MQHHAADHLQKVAKGLPVPGRPELLGLARRSSSEKGDIAASKALIFLTACEYWRISRSLRLPKIFLSEPGIIVGTTLVDGFGKTRILTCPARAAAAGAGQAGWEAGVYLVVGRQPPWSRKRPKVLRHAVGAHLEMQGWGPVDARYCRRKPICWPRLTTCPSLTVIFDRCA